MKYQRLLEGLEVSEVKFSEIDNPITNTRLDAEYFKKAFIRAETRLLGVNAEIKPLNKVTSKIDVGHVGSMAFAYSDDGVPLLQTQNVKQFRIDYNDVIRITREFHRTLIKSQVFPGDCLIARSGSIGNAAFILETDPQPLNCADIIIVRPDKDKVTNGYLAAFLNCYYGASQIARLTSGGVQGHINLGAIEHLHIPRFGEILQKRIHEVVIAGLQGFNSANDLYTQAEHTLLAELGLLDWQPPEPLTYERKASAAFAAGRLDAEHFQEKYLALEKQLGLYSSGTMALGEICLQPVNGVEIREYVEDGVPYLRIGDLQQLDIREDSVVRIDPDAANEVSSKVALNQGDVLVSRSGSLGVTCIVSEDWTGAVISSHLIRIRLTDKRFDPYYVALFLGSMPGKFQIQKRSNGVIQPEINQPALKTIILPILHTEVQKNIRALILQSRETRRTAKALLEQAKRAVEIAIEESEMAALEFLQTSV